MDDKILTPQVVADQPFPQSTAQTTNDPTTTNGSVDTVLSPTTIPDAPLPIKQTAQELINDSFNTRTRSILKDYQFTKSGALQIGTFQNGKSGDLRLSQDGITARDINGNTTFSIDVETGDATFKGTILAGDVEVADADGLISLNNFATDSKTNNSFTTSNTTDTDIPNMVIITTNFTRPVLALVLVQGDVFGTPTSGSGSWGTDIILGLYVNNRGIGAARMRAAFNSTTGAANSDITTVMCHQFVELPAGVSTIKATLASTNQTNGKACAINMRISYLVFGR